MQSKIRSLFGLLSDEKGADFMLFESKPRDIGFIVRAEQYL